MNDRRRELLNLLLNSNVWLSGKELGKILDVSDRTIRSDISALNQDLEKIAIQIQSDTGKGYCLSEESKLILLKEKHRIDWLEDGSPIPKTPEEREAFILYKLVFNDCYYTMEELSEELYVSKTTVYLDLRRILEKCQGFEGLEIEISNLHGVGIKGSEIAKRLVISEVLKTFDRYAVTFDKSFYYATGLDSDQVELELLNIYDLLINTLNQYECSMVDKDLVLLTKEIYIALKRQQLGFELQEYEKEELVLQVIKDLALELEGSFNYSSTEAEKQYLQFCFNSKRLLALGDDFISERQYEEEEKIVDRFINKVKQEYKIDLNQSETFRENMLLHMRPMLLRVRAQIEENNPIIDQIKIKYPFAYEISTKISPIIYDEIGYWINETELSYISLHVAVAINDIFTKKNILIVCGSGFATAKLIKKELIARYNAYINRIRHVSYSTYDAMDSIQEDIIVSTVPLQHLKHSKTVVMVNPILTHQDILNLDAVIKHQKYEDVDQKEVLLKYFPPKLFQIKEGEHCEFKTLIQEMSQNLYKEGYIEDPQRFYKSVLEREKLYSTILKNGIAIPHPMQSMSKTSVVSVRILPKSIEYEGKKVTCILLFAINSQESQSLNDLYYYLKLMAESEEFSQKIRFLKSYQCFIEAIIREDEKK